MKQHTLINQAVHILAVLLLSFGLCAAAVMCPATAYNLSIDEIVLLGGILALCLLCTGLFSFRWGWIPMLGLWALWIFLFYPQLLSGTQALYTKITTAIGPPYGLHFAPWPPESADASALPALLALGAILVTATVWGLLRQESIFPVLILDCIPLGLCLILVDTPPDTIWCLVFLAGVLVLLLSQSARKRSSIGGDRLVLLSLLPSLLLVFGLHRILPQDNYVRGGFGQQVLQSLVELTSEYVPVDVDSLGGLEIRVPTAVVESLNVGPRRDSDATVLQIRAQDSGAMYLRGSAFCTYTGSSWEMLPDEAYSAPGSAEYGLLAHNLPAESIAGPYSLDIRTRSLHSSILLPYYAQSFRDIGTPLFDAAVKNDHRLKDYSLQYTRFSASTLTDSKPESYRFESAYDRFVLEHYLDLPDSTLASALEIARQWGISPNSSPQYIAAMVSNSARYDLETPKMPSGADFAIWFLEESDTGYCVHFASAATVMLRAMGYPARYVTGYLAWGSANKWTDVSSQSAHAWTEVYYPGVGWIPVEPTPSSGVSSTMHPQTDKPAPAPSTTAPPTTVPPDTQFHLPETTAPAHGGADSPVSVQTQAAGKGFRLPIWFYGLVALLAAFFLRRPLTRAMRKRNSRSKTRSAFLGRWSAAARLAKRLGKEPKLEELALKARFSQHRMDPEEFSDLAQWEKELQEAVSALPIHKKLLIRWIWVAD